MSQPNKGTKDHLDKNHVDPSSHPGANWGPRGSCRGGPSCLCSAVTSLVPSLSQMAAGERISCARPALSSGSKPRSGRPGAFERREISLLLEPLRRLFQLRDRLIAAAAQRVDLRKVDDRIRVLVQEVGLRSELDRFPGQLLCSLEVSFAHEKHRS